ncbi:hypothetical protein VO24_13465 [Salmonella enterica]|nr:hypothetical protein [Salmonella enterica]EBP4448082.1 hypothetical protein [Salmonella enterica]
MGSCAAPSAKGDDKFITTDYLQQCRKLNACSRFIPATTPITNITCQTRNCQEMNEPDELSLSLT